MSILNVEHLSHGFGDRAIFEDVSFRLLKGEHIGLVGANGEGKSTFMNIITGRLMPDEGKIEWAKKVRVGYLDQHTALEKGMTIGSVLSSAFDFLYDMENEMNDIYARLGDVDEDEMNKLMEEAGTIQDMLTMHDFYMIDAKVEEVARALGLLDLGLDKDVTDLSGGQRTKVLMGKLLLEKPDILLLDEPTNYLDVEHIEWLKRYLNDYENAFILISHDIPFLNSVVNLIYHMDNKKLDRYVGDYDKFMEVYEMKKAQLEAAYNKQQQEIKELKDFVARNKARVATRNMAMSRQKKLDKMDVIELAAEKPKPEFNFKTARTPGRYIFQTNGLVIGYDDPLSSALDLEMERGQKIVLTGANGIGKTTLLKSILGLIKPLSGSVTLGDYLEIGYFEQEMDQSVTTTCIEEIWNEFPAFSQYEVRSALAKCGLTTKHIESQVRVLSGGEQAKVRLCKLINRETNILLLDEPTNHLDNEMVTWLEDYLNRFKGVVIMVTHDRYFLDKVTNKILEISHGKVYSYDANYSGFLELKAQREEMELASERKRQSILRMELEWAKRGCRARSTKQRARLERLEALKNGKAPVQETDVQMDSVETRMGKKTVELHHISKSYGDKVILEDFDYIVLRNQRLGIIGPNGCGKSTLIRIIDGMVEPDSGTVEIGETIKIGYFAQEVPDMDGNQRVIDYIRDVAEFIPTRDGKISASMMLERFLFDSAMQYTPVAKLSGGEKRRLYLLKVLMEAPNVLLLDEPSNDLDIPTLTILEDYLSTFSGIVITVSHDRYFLDDVVDRIFAFEGNGKLTQYEGGYTDYAEAKARKYGGGSSEIGAGAGSSLSDKAASGNNSTEDEGKKPTRKDWKQGQKSEKLKFTYKEEREYAVIDEDIARLEEKIARLENDMMANATNSVKLREIMADKEAAEKQLEEKMDRWVYLNDLAERIEAQKNNG